MLAERLRRLAPGRLSASQRVWLFACWALTAALAVVILVPGLTAGMRVAAPGEVTAPLGLRVLLVVAGGVAAGAVVAAALLRTRAAVAPARSVGLVLATAVFPVVALTAERHLLAAAGALALVAGAVVVARRGGAASTALLVTGTWLVLAVTQVAADADGGWTWIALVGLAAAFAAFGAYYGVARAAESRTAVFRPLFRDAMPLAAVFGVVGLVVVLTVLRLTVARELFPAPDPELWSPFAEAPLSWLHAAVVAALVVVVAVRSVRRPLRRSRARGTTAALAVAGNADLVLAALVLVVGLLAATVAVDVPLPAVPPVAVALLKFLGVAGVTAVALLPPFHGTTARALAVVTGAFLLPLTLHGLLAQLGLLPVALSGFPASPVQIALVLLAASVVAALTPPVRRALGAAVVVRLAVVPFVAVHAGWLLPAAWSDLGRIVLVVGVLLALFVLLPRPDPDARVHAASVLAASAAQLFALVVFVLALPSFVDDASFVVLGLFWLSVAVIAALVVRTQPGSDDVAAQPVGSSSASSSA